MAVDPLPGALSLEEFSSSSGTNQSEDVSSELRSIVEVIALTGQVWHNWFHVRKLLGHLLGMVLDEFDKMRKGAEDESGVGPPKPLASGETYPELRERLLKALDSFQDGPPFTVQRLCELLLNPKQHSNLHRLSFALEKVLLVTSCVEPPSEAYPSLPLPPGRLEALYALPQPPPERESGAGEAQGQQGPEGGSPAPAGEGDGLVAEQVGAGVAARMVGEEEGPEEPEEGEQQADMVIDDREVAAAAAAPGDAEMAGAAGSADEDVLMDASGGKGQEGHVAAAGGTDDWQGAGTVTRGKGLMVPGGVEGSSASSSVLQLGEDIVSATVPMESTGPEEAMESLAEVGYVLGEPGALPEDIVAGGAGGGMSSGSLDNSQSVALKKSDGAGSPRSAAAEAIAVAPLASQPKSEEEDKAMAGSGAAVDAEEEADRVVAEYLLDSCDTAESSGADANRVDPGQREPSPAEKSGGEAGAAGEKLQEARETHESLGGQDGPASAQGGADSLAPSLAHEAAKPHQPCEPDTQEPDQAGELSTKDTVEAAEPGGL